MGVRDMIEGGARLEYVPVRPCTAPLPLPERPNGSRKAKNRQSQVDQ
jgi:hypothetical protein